MKFNWFFRKAKDYVSTDMIIERIELKKDGKHCIVINTPTSIGKQFRLNDSLYSIIKDVYYGFTIIDIDRGKEAYTIYASFKDRTIPLDILNDLIKSKVYKI